MIDSRLSPALKKKLEDIMYQIADKSFPFTKKNDLGLINGVSGEVLFFSYLYRYTKAPKYQEIKEKLLEILYELANTDREAGLTFSYGLSGVGWLLTTLADNGMIDDDSYSEAYFEDIDKILLNRLDSSRTKFEYDLFRGYLGYAIYALSRLKRNSEYSTQILRTVVALLDSQKIESSKGLSWKYINLDNVPLEKRTKDDEVIYNVGLAHGIPSILMLLSILYSNNIEKEKCKSLIIGGFNWLKNTSEEYVSNFKETHYNTFPGAIFSDYSMSHSRLSWCYGDLSIALTLGNIAKNLDDKTIYAYGEKLAISAAENTLGFYSLSDQACVCHGSAGNAHMLYRLYKIFEKPILLDAAIKFYERIVDQQQDSDFGIAGFKSVEYDPINDNRYYKANAGFLTGTSGIGLAILSLLSDNHEWDRAILLS